MKKQKIDIKLPVEEVENLLKCFDYIISTLEFWKLDNHYPGNFIIHVCAQFQYYLDKVLHEQYWDKSTPKS